MTALEIIEHLIKHGYNFNIQKAFIDTDAIKYNFVHIKMELNGVIEYDNLNPGEFSREEYLRGKLWRMQKNIERKIKEKTL